MPQISVLVVDDSVVIRRLVTDALQAEPDIRVVGTAPNGKVALAKIQQLAPDIVTLDIEMPEMDGLTTIKEIRKTHAKLPVIMFSTLSVSGGAATLEALSSGASDYVTKPANVGSVRESMASVREQLIPRIRALTGRVAPAAQRAASRPVKVAVAPAGPPKQIDLLAVGCSTGGPEALTNVLTRMPADLPVPVVVVQHMPPVFTRLFAERLDRASKLHVTEAVDGVTLQPGHVYIAPGDRHLEVVRQGTLARTRLHDGPPECFCRPAVDVLFRSVAAAYKGSALGLVLTGMGQDGKRGSESLREAGSRIVVQDEATSVVWGMPGAVAGAGLAEAVLPLDQIGSAVLERIIAMRRPQAAGAR
ncbi:MAG TPA: chemotaxis response regulator protein-glutamate methylesterase [Mycobacteriales bacterium]|nr:chemotaxis response regulator protein-glutamate methylesterase [Mycobacteriales bacterium]